MDRWENVPHLNPRLLGRTTWSPVRQSPACGPNCSLLLCWQSGRQQGWEKNAACPSTLHVVPPTSCSAPAHHNNHKGYKKQTPWCLKEDQKFSICYKTLIESKYAMAAFVDLHLRTHTKGGWTGLCQHTWLQLICLGLYTLENILQFIISIAPCKNFV